MIYKHDYMVDQFVKTDPKLQAILFEADHWMRCKYNLPITVTCLIRSVEENKQVGGSPVSAHLSGRAADLRSRNYSKEQTLKLVEHISYVWGEMVYCIHHSHGTGPHIHLNVRIAYSTGPKGGL